MAETSFSSFSYIWKYDVFLSFRGKDTRHGFTGHLYKALCDKGIHTFIDDEELQRGELITPSLMKAIEESRIAIPVFSINYASSSFCLEELVNIIACIKEKGRLVLPVFYDVDPSYVRHQRGSYEEALAVHEERFKDGIGKEKVRKWRMALRQVADLSGFDFKYGKEKEYEFIEKIVKEVSNKINRAPLHVADYPVGVESRVLGVNSLLNLGCDMVHMIGIHGIGGIGKTTIARAVYNLIADPFEGLCFLDNVRENSIKHGLVHLQETLLSEILKEKDIKVGSINKGISVIKHRLHRMKILLVLDDVDKLEQLRAIVGSPDWFGSGSRVIITTRDKHLLTSHGIEKIYEVNGFNKKEAIELLSWYAFKTNKVDPGYVNILNRTVAYASGLPLALEVIGSNLFKKSIEEWKSSLDRYEIIPSKEIQKILKVSFDSLEEDEQKIFLDIACCFKGYDSLYVKEILQSHHGFCPKYGIGVLIEKSLLKISANGQMTMHDLIEDMGKEIVRQESPEEPGKRSRLWYSEDIVQVLEENTGSSRIQIILLDFLKFEVVEWDGKALKKMKNLKTLIIREGCFSKGPKYLPNSLRVLEWWGYPSSSLPSKFHPKKLVILNLPQSCIMSLELRASNKKFNNLRILKFDYCQCMTEIPNVSAAPNLEELSFKHCESLIEAHESIGLLDKLRILNAYSCNELRSFPAIKLTSLEELELSYCSSLERFPEILGKMENLTGLYFQDTGIKEFPYSIRNLIGLQRLEVRSYKKLILPSSMAMLPKLEHLRVWGSEELLSSNEDEEEDELSSMLSSNVEYVDLTRCNISNEFLQKGLAWFANVKYLDLSCNKFTILPACIKECCFLMELILDDCENLQYIIGIPPSIHFLSAKNCTSLSFSSTSMLLNQELHERGGDKMFCMPGSRIPEWFEYHNMGLPISFWFRNRIPSISLCFVGDYFLRGGFVTKLIINGIEVNKVFQIDKRYYLQFWPVAGHIHIVDEKIINYEGQAVEVPLEDEWNHVVLSIEVNSMAQMGLLDTQIGLHVFNKKSSMDDIRFTNPYKRGKLNEDLISWWT